LFLGKDGGSCGIKKFGGGRGIVFLIPAQKKGGGGALTVLMLVGFAF